MTKVNTPVQGGEANASATLTVEQLQEQLNVAQDELTAEQEAHKATKAELAAEKEAHEAAQSELAAANGIISDLEAKYAEKASEVKADKTVITVDKKQYEVLPGNFNYEGQVVNAKVLKSNSKLADELIKLGVGFIKKLED